MRTLIILLLCLFASWSTSAQEDVPIDNEVQEIRDSVVNTNFVSTNILQSYYVDQSFLSHSYNYELENKIQKLKKKQSDVWVAGFATVIALEIVGGFLADEHKWNLWVYIPCATVVAMGALVPFALWQSHIDNQIYDLQQRLSTLVSLDENIDISMANYNTFLDPSKNNVGVAISVKF
jgi:hypothetical protein